MALRQDQRLVVGGAIRFIPVHPSVSRYSGHAIAELATTQDGAMSYEAGVAAGSPVIDDNLGIRVGGWYRSEGGFIDQVDPVIHEVTDHDTNGMVSKSGRIGAAWIPSDALRITSMLMYDSSSADDTSSFFVGQSDPAHGIFRKSNFIRQPRDDRLQLATIRVEYEARASDFLAVSSYVEREGRSIHDLNCGDASGIPVFAFVTDGAQRVLQQELRLTSADREAFQIPVQAFPGLWANVYLVLAGPYRVLIDTGSGFGDSNEHLMAGFDQIGRLIHHPKFDLAELTHVFITHGHIDHFGGLNFVKERSPALIGIHELDRRNLTNHEERITVVVKTLQQYLIEAGIRAERVDDLVSLYKLTKSLFHSIPVDFTYEASGMRLGPFEFMHVPGHCAGHVLIRLDDILLVGDHILPEISPHKAPEQLTLSTGLGHYLESLRKMEQFLNGTRMALGGHQSPIVNIPKRIEEIKKVHADRLNQVLSLLDSPCTVKDISKSLFGEVQGYNILLAIEETGGHVEYVYQHGMIEIDNLLEYERTNSSNPILYRRTGALRSEIALG